MNLFKKKKIEPTSQQKIQESKQRVELSLKVFNSISKEIDEVNDVLQSVIDEDTKKVEQLQINISTSKDELVMNKALQEKLQQFMK